MTSEEDFERLLLEAIDEGFSAIGESSKQAIYYHLENGFKIPRQEIPKKIDEFEHAIERIFGLGADFLEILIMKFLCEKVKRRVRLQNPRDFKFTMYVKAAKRSFLQQKEEAEKRITEELVSSSPQG
jgi:hypothetical protein